jgi:PAS domain S-box-containing protein
MKGFERHQRLLARRRPSGKPMGQFNVWVQAGPARGTLVDKLLRDGSLRDALVQLRRRDGNVIDCMVSASLIALEGNSNAYAVWIARDVTVEHAVHEQFAAAFRLTPDSMSISRMKDGTYLEVNAAFERITGYQRDEVIGQTSARLSIWHNPARRKELFKALDTSSTVQNFLIEIRHRHGKTREALLNASVFEARGERYLIALVRDVTDARTCGPGIARKRSAFFKAV